MFVYDFGYGPRCLINPRIIEGEGEQTGDEGCLSFPGIYVTVTRFDRIKTSCFTPSGHNIVIESEGFPARVMQHECDHLDGVLLIDRCDAEERERALEEFQEIDLPETEPDA
jgi:peptide deformylase